MDALLQAASEDTREDPVFGGPGDLDFDGDMAQLTREVYPAFKSEVSGADMIMRASASKLKDVLANLQAAAQGNTPLLHDHARATTMAARAATSRERAFLANSDDVEPVMYGKRSRAKPSAS